jgi:hypothetical protein
LTAPPTAAACVTLHWSKFSRTSFYATFDPDRRPRDNAAMSRKPAVDDPSRPNVYRVEALAVREILADKSTDPEEVTHREWLKRRMEAEVRKVASIPTKLRR